MPVEIEVKTQIYKVDISADNVYVYYTFQFDEDQTVNSSLSQMWISSDDQITYYNNMLQYIFDKKEDIKYWFRNSNFNVKEFIDCLNLSDEQKEEFTLRFL
jgi:hypothetical protein